MSDFNKEIELENFVVDGMDTNFAAHDWIQTEVILKDLKDSLTEEHEWEDKKAYAKGIKFLRDLLEYRGVQHD